MKIETVVEVLKNEIKNMGDSFKDYAKRNDKDHEEFMDKIDKFIAESKKQQSDFCARADDKYASKEYEKVMKVAIGLILTTFFVSIIALVFK